ncbi:energy-coupling factor transporter transmembrane protein EcfT [Corynebacterium sp. ES2794-CONJ1]|uniref:energy-coupling factor transporter transmembrane protein EcfT n=1 Tax=Corynebacterium sp. ES2794-CONJ1 TaxID=2980553 RepID=UPI0021D7F4E0|nr:energy-coupling factor transporter transmembrane protein EcfT [Corynebacterium sp. ES2794-CONJ1]MCU9519286.1 energy-coupling factor transporter transmembrane protein EcfT [Corynebacterium sp. ES2794-CONJ1]
MINPLTTLSFAAATWIFVLGGNDLRISLLVCAIALTAACLKTVSLRPLGAVLTIVTPVALSIAIIHIPFGEQSIAPLITRDGGTIALHLSVRFAALMASAVAAFSFFTPARLNKAMQLTRIHHSVTFLITQSLQFLPFARHVLETVITTNTLAGRRASWRHPFMVVEFYIFPLIMQLLHRAGEREVALHALGVDLAGRRSVYCPERDPWWEKIARPSVIIAAMIGGVL